MAAMAFIDQDRTLSCVERGGVVRSLVRLVRVCQVELPTGNNFFGGYQALWVALEAAGIPKVPSTLSGAGFERLVLTERRANVIDNDAGTVDVTLSYSHFLDGENQELNLYGDPYPDYNGLIFARVRSSMKQVTTNKYTDWKANPPKKDVPIFVEYTYPTIEEAKAKNWPKPMLYPGQKIRQPGEVSVAIPNKVLHFGGYIVTTQPVWYEKNLLNHVNQYTWMGEPPGTWMFTEVAWEPVKQGRFRFMFEVQNNYDGWNPTAVFIDQETGRPPPNLVKGVGQKTIPYFPEVDYATILAAFIEGWNQQG